MGAENFIGRPQGAEDTLCHFIPATNAVSCHKFLERTVTGDETWVHHHALETKCSSMEWKHPGSPRMNKFIVH